MNIKEGAMLLVTLPTIYISGSKTEILQANEVRKLNPNITIFYT
jgi:hypothetical protein